MRPPWLTIVTAPVAPSGLSRKDEWGFVSRQGDQLFVTKTGSSDKVPFRFISFNIPNLHIIEDSKKWHRIDPIEQEDALRTLQAMGATVTRIYTFSVSGWWNDYDKALSHIQSAGQYNEDLFRDFDILLSLCQKYKVKVPALFLFLQQTKERRFYIHFISFLPHTDPYHRPLAR